LDASDYLAFLFNFGGARFASAAGIGTKMQIACALNRKLENTPWFWEKARIFMSTDTHIVYIRLRNKQNNAHHKA
jgi:hypothetical protein